MEKNWTQLQSSNAVIKRGACYAETNILGRDAAVYHVGQAFQPDGLWLMI